MIHFEDLEIGATDRFGRYEVQRDEVIEFARKYDPQAFHLSDEGAAGTMFGRLCASGWHTSAMMMAMWVEYMEKHEMDSRAGAGVDDLRWTKPVYPGDVLSCEITVRDKRLSGSRSDIGRVWIAMKVLNQEGQTVMSAVLIGLFGLRGSAG